MRMMMKAQAAMEYLMTYGWAILIVIIVATALYSLGIFNPATWTGKRATGFANIGAPVDWLYGSTGKFNITLRNSLGQTITFTQVTATCGPSGAPVDLGHGGTSIIGAGSTIEFYNDSCTSLSSGSGFSLTISASYTRGTGVYGATDAGTVTGTIS